MILNAYICIYFLGGITFLPLLACLVLIHAYWTFPQPVDAPSLQNGLEDSRDDDRNIRSGAAINALASKFRREHEGQVASGYFAVCREWVPGGVNGKPPERTTPAGQARQVVSAESPSIYQNMYRSIFDRRQGPSLDPGKGTGKNVKRARNVFFVVLRHGHIMLYDDSEQLDPRHVIFLEHHDVSIFGGEEEIPEGELWIKRNSIRLSRKPNIEDGTSTSKPFFFFSENCSEKEDFYFALLQNQEVKPNAPDSPPRPQQYAVKDIITLVKQLHSSEEQLETRWINGLIGRLFLALYKTQEVEDFIRRKITKKIARVKKPAFLSGIVLRRVDMGAGAPYITHPKLKDLTVDGDCCAEADFKYNGHFRLEIAAAARIELGARFRAREVNLVLAVVVKRLEGHVLVKFKPPPSNRIWMSFETMPDIDMAIEPIVSSRQITYNIILRAIESRIREVVAETLVLPHWDDSPFFDTSQQHFRGGIWAKSPDASAQMPTDVPNEVVEDETEAGAAIDLAPLPSPKSKDDRSVSLPAEFGSPDQGLTARKATTSSATVADGTSTASTTGSQKRPAEAPKAIRSRSFASAAGPLVSMDTANVASAKNELKEGKYADATSAMMAISQRSPPMSPTEVAEASDTPTLLEKSNTYTNETNSMSSISSKASSLVEPPTSMAVQFATDDSANGDARSDKPSAPYKRQAPMFIQADTRTRVHLPEKRYTTATLGAATAAAKKWGWGVLSRNPDQKALTDPVTEHEKPGTPEHPIGRGQPLPPPGQPLPFPNRKASQISLPKRKPVPAPLMGQSRQDETRPRDEKLPTLPRRRRQESVDKEAEGGDVDGDGLLVVEAPVGSEPESPIDGGEDVSLDQTGAEPRTGAGAMDMASDLSAEATQDHLAPPVEVGGDNGKSPVDGAG